jgi:hypothetical protein
VRTRATKGKPMVRAQLCVSFPFGSLVRLTAVFTREPTDEEIADGTAEDTDDWQPVDPDVVTAWVRDPDDNVTDHAYEDSPSDIERDDVGEYHLDLTPDLAGTWYYGFISTGSGAAAKEHRFVVEPTMRVP